MQAILCRFAGPTNSRPARWIISCDAGRRVYPANGPTSTPRDAIARFLSDHAAAMAGRYGDSQDAHHWGRFTVGTLPTGDYCATLNSTRQFNPDLCG